MPGTLPGGGRVLFSERAHGDLRAEAGPAAEARRRALVDMPWTTPHQVHGRGVAVLAAGSSGSGVEADAVVTAEPGQAIAVLGADCALVGLASAEGVLAVAHAGWRGLLAGVVEATVEAMAELGAGTPTAVLGPCIHPECYAFGEGDLAPLEARFGPSVRSATSDGRPALDLPAGVAAALADVGVAPPEPLAGCSACDGRFYSFRARRDEARHGLVLWREPA